MKFHSRKTIYTLFAVLALLTAGTAWAVATGTIITLDSNATNLNVNTAYYETAGTLYSTSAPFTVAGTAGTQSGTLTLPTANILHNLGSPNLATWANQTATAGRSVLTAFWHTPGSNGWDTEGTTARRLHNSVFGPTQSTADTTFNDWGGAIDLQDGQTLILRPSAGNAIVGNQPAYDPFTQANIANAAARTAGFLRLNGGTTTIYGGNANDPNDTTRNNYNGGLFLIRGNLNVAHSNAFGEGHVMLAGGTTMRVIENDTTLGNSKYDTANTSLGNDQYLFLRKVANDANRGRRDSYSVSDVNVIADGGRFTVNSGVREFITYAGLSESDKDDTYGIRLVKSGDHPFSILSDRVGGAWHSRGTVVEEGSLIVTSSGTAKYAASLGATWNGLVGYNESTYKVQTDPDEEEEVALAAYNAAVTDGVAVPYKNYLTIKEGASVTVNRDQFFGQFSGAGAFNVSSWNKASGAGSVPGGVKLPQITIQTDSSYMGNTRNYYTNRDFSEENVFSGPVSGTFDLVLNTGYLPDGTTDTVLPTNSQTAWRKVLKFTGEDNAITSGDTTIVDGILSARTVDNLPPGSIYVGADDDRNGYKEHLPHTGGFESSTTATFHANGSFATAADQLVTIGTPAMRNEFDRVAGDIYNFPGFAEASIHAGLAADRGTSMSLPLVEVYSGLAINEEFRVADDILNAPRSWEGEIRFTDDYSFPESTKSNPTNIVIDRGTLHLEKLPSDIESATDKGYFDVQINPTGVLSLGEEARDFSEVLNVTFGALKMQGVEGEDEERIRLVVKPGDIASSKTEARQKPAIFQAGHIDYIGLGAGERNRDKRIVIQLDLSQVGNKIAKDTWIKVIESPQAINWTNLHFLRENSTTHDEDYAKIRVAYTDNVTIDGQNLRARLDQNTYAIYVNAQADVEESTEPPSQDFTFNSGSDVVTSASEISGTVTVAGVSASLNVKFELLRNGVVIAEQDRETDNNGVATYKFVPADASLSKFAGAYVVRASAEGYESGTKSITTPDDSTEDPGRPGSGGGCDAGFGLFGLLAATGAVALLRRKG